MCFINTIGAKVFAHLAQALARNMCSHTGNSGTRGRALRIGCPIAVGSWTPESIANSRFVCASKNHYRLLYTASWNAVARVAKPTTG